MSRIALFALPLLLVGCAISGDGDICADAEDHYFECTGEVVDLGPDCDASAAEEVVDTSCEGLSDGKGDLISDALCAVGISSACPSLLESCAAQDSELCPIKQVITIDNNDEDGFRADERWSLATEIAHRPHFGNDFMTCRDDLCQATFWHWDPTPGLYDARLMLPTALAAPTQQSISMSGIEYPCHAVDCHVDFAVDVDLTDESQGMTEVWLGPIQTDRALSVGILRYTVLNNNKPTFAIADAVEFYLLDL